MSPKSKAQSQKLAGKSRVESRESKAKNSKLKTQNSKFSQTPHSALRTPQFVMIGGFLGAGKTTAVAKLAQHLTKKNLRVGLITNDQGNQLVDTAMLRSHGFVTEEISGGCFCCRFNSLVDAAKNLSTQTRPDVFIAEPVGSCTDLVATVSYPLRRIYGEDFSIAPLSVLVDPIRAARIFGLEDGGKFSDKVIYIYRKQLEEADFIVINKCELLAEKQLSALRKALAKNFSRAKILEISARTGAGLENWFSQIAAGEQSAGAAMEVDYAVYADGEALLGWLNAAARFSAEKQFDGNKILQRLAASIQKKLNRNGAEVAHLKMTLEPDESLGDLAVINLVRNDCVPELSLELQEPMRAGELIINLRAEVAPEILRDAVEKSLAQVAKTGGLKIKLHHLENFRPGKPVPTHRVLNGR